MWLLLMTKELLINVDAGFANCEPIKSSSIDDFASYLAIAHFSAYMIRSNTLCRATCSL